MRWIILFFYFWLTGCVSSALSGANIIYKHKHLQDEMSDYYINIKSWNMLKRNYPPEDIKQLHLTSFQRIVLLTGHLPNDQTRNEISHSLQAIPNIARIYNATEVGGATYCKQQARDSWITAKIKSKMIASNEIYADKIKVVTENNIVYLIGIVTRQEAEQAIYLTKQTDGVAKVVTIFYYMIMPEI